MTRTHLQSALEELMAQLRTETMDLFARELMLALGRENYHLEDILNGLATYGFEEFNDEVLVKHLEEASDRVKELRRQSQQ